MLGRVEGFCYDGAESTCEQQQNHYDDYNASGAAAFSPVSGVVAQSDLAASAKGMLTYDRTFELYSNWACEARERTYRYDSRGRCVQTYTRYPAGINCRTSVKYDYAGNPLTTVEQYTYGSSALTITTERTFDSRGRKLTELTTVNGNTVAHAAFAYDEMGRMTETSLNGNIEITADYNLQGWLTRLQASKKSDGFIISDVIFDETLRYHDTNDSLAVPLYAGKIAQLDWQRRMLISGNDRFLYRYDPQGRLIKAEHRITGIGNSTDGNYSEETEYDLNSNITSFNAVKEDENIQRVYTLNGNRIVGAEYDSRGNITRIPGKNLQIEYNLCNLPQSVTAGDGTKINYSYLSDGTKFRAVSQTGVNYLYTGSLRWKLQGGTITPESFAIAGGRATLEANGWTAHYYITDHLGSTRAVTDTLGNVLATFDYTPYGELLASSDNTTAGTDYLFTGKENQGKQGAGELYDSKARFMDTGGRFLSIDPLAEEYYHLSPYAYCAGDPVNLVDPDGKAWDIVWDVFSIGVGLYSLRENIIQGEYGDACIDAGGIVVDVIAAFAPFVPGGVGASLKFTRATDDVIDAGKVVNKADDVVDAGKTTKTLKKGPDPNGGQGGKHGNPDHDKAIDDAVKALPREAKNIRKNQVQVDINGNKVGNNRPDIQYNLNGKHYNIEIDRNLKNSQRHETVIMRNDPNSNFNRIIIK